MINEWNSDLFNIKHQTVDIILMNYEYFRHVTRYSAATCYVLWTIYKDSCVCVYYVYLTINDQNTCV